jgi:enoyl-[acyl-carrier protein] reductase II
MAWCSGARLAAAVSAAGGVGLIGGASMDADLFRRQIRKARGLTKRKVGVNIPLTFHQAEALARVAIEEEVPIVFTSAGSPRRFTPAFKARGMRVFHVAPSPDLARKCEAAGVDGVVVEGFEAGGHNAHEELTTMVLVPQVTAAVTIPVLAAGGIGNGRQMAAAFALGASGVQIGTRFAMTQESSAHPAFKEYCAAAGPNCTRLVLKKNIPVRMMPNRLRSRIEAAEASGATREELLRILGRGRPEAGMFRGDIEEGMLEIGQVAGMLDDLPPVAAVFDRLLAEYEETRHSLPPLLT